MPGSAIGSTSSTGATAQSTLSEDETLIKVVNKTLLQMKQSNATVRVEDLEKVFGEVIRLEEGTNRALRNTNRNTNQSQLNISRLAGEINTGFATVTTQISSLAEKVSILEKHNLGNAPTGHNPTTNLPMPNQQPNRKTPHATQPQAVQPTAVHPSQSQPTAAMAANDDDDEGSDTLERTFQSINMITDASPIPLEVYRDDCIVTYDRWAKRFREYMDAFGKKLDDKDKLARLVIYLDGVPKRILEKMDTSRKSTIELALTNLRTDLDSPQSQGLSRQALMACRQIEGEPVKDFLNRFIPLAEASVADVKDQSQREGQLRELFLERLRPNISLVMKMLDMSRGKKFEQLCLEAREVEGMLAAQNSGMPFVQSAQTVQAMQGTSQQFTPTAPAGNFQTLTPTGPNRFPDRNAPMRQNGFRPQAPRNAPWFREQGNRNFGRGQGPAYDRRWNNRQVCTYCKRVGHVANACRTRTRDFQERQGGTAFQSRDFRDQRDRRPPTSGANAIQQDRTMALLDEIAQGMRTLSVEMGKQKSLNDVNAVVELTRATAHSQISIKESASNDKPKIEPERIASWEKVTLGPKLFPLLPIIIMINLLALLASSTAAAIPMRPMICQTEIQPTIWSLPMEHNTEAWACRKIKKGAKKFTTLSGVPVSETISPEMLTVSVDECRRMAEHKTCDRGMLMENDGLWGTQHEIDLTPSLADRIVLMGHHGKRGLFCFQNSGNCTLKDKTVLIWTPETQTNCRYTSVGRFKGRFVANTWLSEDAQYGLHFKNKAQKVRSCNNLLEISEQGFATRVVSSKRSRSRRDHDSGEGLGLVTSPELNAQLTYLDNDWVESLTYALRHAFKAQCDVVAKQRELSATAYLMDPTGLARTLFNNTKLYATRAGSSLLKIWPCVQLKKGEFRFKPTRLAKECFDKMPIEFVTKSMNRLAFLDPTTMIIHPDSSKVPCTTHFRKAVVQIENQVLEVDQVTGETKELPVKKFNTEPRFPEMFELAKHSFHQTALINVTDLNSHAFVSGMVRAKQWKELSDELEKEVIGDYRLTWLFLWLPILLETYAGPGWLGRMLVGKKRPRPALEPVELERIAQRSPSPAPTEELQGVQGDPRSWPPSVSIFPSRLSSSNPESGARNTDLRTINKPTGMRLRPASIALGGTSAVAISLALITSLSLIQPSDAATAHSNSLGQNFDMESTTALLFAMAVALGLVMLSMSRWTRYFTSETAAKTKEANSWATAPLKNLKLEEIVAMNVPTTPRLSATIRAFINGRPISCLVDTGASISLAPMSLAQALGCRTQPTSFNVRSASGHPIDIRAAAQTHLEIVGHKIFGDIKLVQDNILSDRQDYQLILGCDLMAELPPITFDFKQGKLSIQGKSVPLGERGSVLYSNVKVTALKDADLPPGSFCVLDGKLKAHSQLDQVITHSLDKRLGNAHVGLVSTVTNPNNGNIKMILTNPTDAPVRIHAGMHVALANELRQSAEEPWLEEQKRQVKEEAHEKSSDEEDPAFAIDFSKGSAKGEDLRKLKELCEEFADVFSKSQYDLGSCLVGEHDIITTTEEPLSTKPRRTPFRFREEVRDHMEKWLKTGVMVKSDTPWISNIVLVQKKDGGLRPCIDFRKLNEVTVPDHFPLPRLEVVLEKVGNCHWYTSLDLSSGFLQIRLTERASRKCGIITEDDVFQMTHMPFGLRNATSAFARVMAHVLSGLEESVIAYVDDFLIYTKSPDFKEHLDALRQVFGRLRQYDLKVSPKKCVLASAKMEFLGFVISKNVYTPSLSKIEVIKNLPNPTSLKEVRSMVGMASFFRKHIAGFSTTVEPLTKLTRKEIPFVWESEQQIAFDKIKKILCEKPVLRFPDYTKPFHIFTDASNVGQGGALMQKDEESKAFHAVAYCSRTLSASERKWPTVQVELGAIIYALRQFRPFIYMGNVELHTDHKPLAYLLQKADAHPNLARWLIELQNYSIKIVHVAGKQNLLADALSRAAHDCCSEEEIKNLKELEDIAEFPACLSLSLESRLVMDESVNMMTLRGANGNSYTVDLKLEQKADHEATAFIKFIETGEMPEGMNETEKERFALMTANLIFKSGILFFKEEGLRPRIFVPASLRPLVFDSFHSSPLGGGHMNMKKTLRKCRKYFWHRMHADIVNWVRSCITCQLRHMPTPGYRAEMKLPQSNTLFAKVGLDLAGPFPITKEGNRHILCIICWFTRFVIAVPVQDAKATTLVKAFLSSCYLKFGGCTELITDNATAFTSEFFREFCSTLYINKRYATPHWSQRNAITERSFRTFHNIMAKYISSDQPDFDEHLDMVTFCYNTATHQSTGESPFFLMYGRDPIFCVDQMLDPRTAQAPMATDLADFKFKLVSSLRSAWEATAAESAEAQLRAKAQYDKLVRVLEVSVGDRVLLRNYAGKVGTSRKFHLPWKGIFRVIEVEGVMITIVSCNAPQANPKIVHINQLKKCVDILGPACTVPNISEEERDALKKAGAKEVQNMAGYDHQGQAAPPEPEPGQQPKEAEIVPRHTHNLRTRRE
uniref:RNA-directed DNA polymerase n=1 Tax=Globodera rostochiensis TaxID=31243 RepID=A0A914HZ71_GLORO